MTNPTTSLVGQASAAASPSGTIVRIDRTIKQEYPEWGETLYPKLEQSGPEEFDLAKLGWDFFPLSGRGYAGGNRILRYLNEHNLLNRCLNMQDALAIERLGLETFQKHFKASTVLFWKSILEDRDDGSLWVTCLSAKKDGLECHLLDLKLAFDFNEHQTLYFPR